MPFGGPCRSACIMVESFENLEQLIWSRRLCWSGAHCHWGLLMAVWTSLGVACRRSYRRMMNILNTSSTSCQHLYSNIIVCCIRYNRWTICKSLTYDFFKLSVCGSYVDHIWCHPACQMLKFAWNLHCTTSCCISLHVPKIIECYLYI